MWWRCCRRSPQLVSNTPDLNPQRLPLRFPLPHRHVCAQRGHQPHRVHPNALLSAFPLAHQLLAGPQPQSNPSFLSWPAKFGCPISCSARLSVPHSGLSFPLRVSLCQLSFGAFGRGGHPQRERLPRASGRRGRCGSDRDDAAPAPPLSAVLALFFVGGGGRGGDRSHDGARRIRRCECPSLGGLRGIRKWGRGSQAQRLHGDGRWGTGRRHECSARGSALFPALVSPFQPCHVGRAGLSKDVLRRIFLFRGRGRRQKNRRACRLRERVRQLPGLLSVLRWRGL